MFANFVWDFNKSTDDKIAKNRYFKTTKAKILQAGLEKALGRRRIESF